MKTALLLVLMSVAFVGCESGDAIAKAAKSARNGSAVASASAKGRYEFKDGILTFKDALAGELYDENGEDCSFEIEAGQTVTVKALDHEGILIANKNPEYADIPFNRVSGEIDENNLIVGTFELESESDTTYETTQLKFDEEFVEFTVQCEAR